MGQRVMRLRALGYVITSGAVFGALALQPLALLTVVSLFTDSADPAARPIVEGLPTPAGLAWSPRTLDAVRQIGRLPSAGVLGFEVALYGVLAYLLFRALNPTFRVTTGIDWNARILTKTYMHTAPLIKAFLIAVTAFIPLAGLWWLVSAVIGRPGIAYIVQAAVTGAAAWLLFSLDGVAGDYESGNYLWPSERGVVLSLVGRGALAGALAGLCGRLAPFNPPDRLFAFHALLGGIGEAEWWRVFWPAVGLSVALGMACAGACVSLAAPGVRLRQRSVATGACVVVCAAVLWVGRVALPGRMRDRYDLDPTKPASVSLALRTAVALAPSGADTVLLIGGGHVDALQVDRQSITGLDLSAPSRARIEAFLRRRAYRTTLSSTAFATLYDGAALDWNDEELLRLSALRCEKCPDTMYAQLLVAKLETCAATAVAKRYAALLADDSRFLYGDRDARLLAGDVFARLGMRPLAEKWYRLGGIAETRIDDRLSAQSRFTDGVVAGQLLLNGRQASGVRVGLIGAEALAHPADMFWANGRLRPYWMRMVSPSAVTDGQGRFRLEHVVAGAYRTIAYLPGPTSAHARPTLRRAGPDTGSVYIGFAAGSVDLGRLDVAIGR